MQRKIELRDNLPKSPALKETSSIKNNQKVELKMNQAKQDQSNSTYR